MGVARHTYGGGEHWRQHFPDAMRRLLLWVDRPGGSARAETGPENRGRTGDPRVHRHFHALLLFWNGRVDVVTTSQPHLWGANNEILPVCRRGGPDAFRRVHPGGRE